jgi:predicted enzyme related to lactoylglutathione lyase
MTAHLGLVLDCSDADALAGFWGPALGYENVGRAGTYVLLMPTDGSGAPQLLLQQVDEPKPGKNRMHFDIHVEQIDAEAERLVGLGARRLRDDAMDEHGTRWFLMADPEGNEFCICDSV